MIPERAPATAAPLTIGWAECDDHTKITVKGGWIDVTLAGETLTLAAVGSPLHYLVKPPTSIPARHKQSEDKSRFRRLAVDAILAVDNQADPGDAEIVWSWRAG